MTRMRILVVAGLLLAATSIGAVLAQTEIKGLDFQAIEARAKTEASGLTALMGQPLVKPTQATDAQATIDAAKRKLVAAANKSSSSPSVPGSVDLDAIVAQAATLTAPSPPSEPQFLAFASLSMPPEALKAMIEDVSRAGGTVVFRGFVSQGAAAFMAGLNQVIPEGTRPRISIDPRLFKAFHVEAVPTYVAVANRYAPCADEECSAAPPAYDRLSGNVTALFAAETIAGGNGPGGPAARAAVQALEATP